ncbi:MAG: L-serine ammonia-lyase, iron-sulfur-dependent, subunit alpha, partial [Muribaculaceae bacterium]|nr:L-serine ammonia-lyase, iron-sulfur-dependent, subunit alpha [Muribaculaceae bacterium]
MESIRQLYKIGYGPSSSHTMGPRKAAQIFSERNASRASRYTVTLYGALAATGRGHLTDQAILSVLTEHAPAEIVWKPETVLPFHTNGMKFESFGADGTMIESWTVYSVGGGDIVEEGQLRSSGPDIYPLHRIKDIQEYCERTGKSYWEFVDENEGPQIWDYLAEVWQVMKEAVERGIEAEGVLPGGLGVRRKAVSYYVHAAGYADSLKSRGLVYAYALAVSEENAAGGKIVTAPTCGSCGIVPGVLYHLATSKKFSDRRILRALATAGLFGNVVTTNASVSCAELGCQGEVGVA